MKFARFTAFGVILLTALWIGSGYLRSSTPAPPPARMAEAERPPFRVLVESVKLEQHARRLALTGRTQSDQRVLVSARTNGIVKRLAVKRGALVQPGDLIAELSDEAREAKVAEAKARLAQRAAELEARQQLAQRGNYPTLSLEQLRAEKEAAEASLATAEAELARTRITAPIAGIVNDLPVEIGQGLVMGTTIADLIAPDPMLAVVEVPERRLAGLRLGDPATLKLVTGETREGKISFIARRPGGQTRTYRVDVTFSNADATISEGIAAEVLLTLAPVAASRVPRSALTFSSEGQLGLRIVDEGNIVRFRPVELVDDETTHLWVTGLTDAMRLITRGQDFIREGQKVEPVTSVEALAKP
ncbi:MAG: efflux RND transporter periplasmic adaptor subunit [Beijerinckiaceae bacterium]|jgi:multidrug efflux system membrane fusion protein|nr:efflux RND transporter periplasmic adaptor subunit [Beijerinckiaceae bacterium]